MLSCFWLAYLVKLDCKGYKIGVHVSVCAIYSLEITMADGNEWGIILKGKYKLFDVERSIYTESQMVANGPLMFAQFIFDALRPGDVPDTLRKIYEETVYGTNDKVKARIISRMYSIGRIVR